MTSTATPSPTSRRCEPRPRRWPLRSRASAGEPPPPPMPNGRGRPGTRSGGTIASGDPISSNRPVRPVCDARKMRPDGGDARKCAMGSSRAPASSLSRKSLSSARGTRSRSPDAGGIVHARSSMETRRPADGRYSLVSGRMASRSLVIVKEPTPLSPRTPASREPARVASRRERDRGARGRCRR